MSNSSEKHIPTLVFVYRSFMPRDYLFPAKSFNFTRKIHTAKKDKADACKVIQLNLVFYPIIA